MVMVTPCRRIDEQTILPVVGSIETAAPGSTVSDLGLKRVDDVLDRMSVAQINRDVEAVDVDVNRAEAHAEAACTGEIGQTACHHTSVGFEVVLRHERAR